MIVCSKQEQEHKWIADKKGINYKREGLYQIEHHKVVPFPLLPGYEEKGKGISRITSHKLEGRKVKSWHVICGSFV